MNLLDKILKGAVLSLFLIACEDPGDLGLELDPGDSETEVRFQEFVLPASTFYMDSMRTDRGSRMLVGSNTDSVYGHVSAQSFLELTYSEGQQPLDCLDVVSGSVSFELSETLSLERVASLRLEVRALTDTIFPARVYNRDDVISTEEIPVDTWSIGLDDSDSIVHVDLGRGFVSQLWALTESTSDINDVRYSMNIRATDDSNGLLSLDLFADTTALIITTRDPLDTLYTTTYRFTNQFSQVQRDRTGSRMAPLQQTGDSLSTVNGLSYVNGAAGTVAKLSLKPFLDFINENENIIVNKTDIEIPISSAQNNAIQNAVQGVNLYYFKEGTVINGPGVANDVFNTAVLEEVEYQSLTGLPVPRVLLFSEDDQLYTATITLFSQSLVTDKLAGDDFLTENLVVTPGNWVGAGQSSLLNSGIKLKVFYTTVK